MDAFLLSERKRVSEKERALDKNQLVILFLFQTVIKGLDREVDWTVYKLWQIEPKNLGRSLSDVPKSEARESEGKRLNSFTFYFSLKETVHHKMLLKHHLGLGS